MRHLGAPHHDEIRSPEAYLITIASHVVQQHHQKRVATPMPLEMIERLAELPYRDCTMFINQRMLK